MHTSVDPIIPRAKGKVFQYVFRRGENTTRTTKRDWQRRP